MSKFPNFLAAINKRDKKIFILATPDICAIKHRGRWHRSLPLSDNEIKKYILITDLELASHFVKEAKITLGDFSA